MGFDEYLQNFTYESRKEMKIKPAELIKLLKENRAVLVDIRFPEEFVVWNIQPSMNIPLNELPERYKELDTSKVIVTACPHNERSVIAMAFLRSKGIKAKYLVGGLIALAEELRGDAAKDFFEKMNKRG
jgi:rhodanese-related sulfurtransferase